LETEGGRRFRAKKAGEEKEEAREELHGYQDGFVWNIDDGESEIISYSSLRVGRGGRTRRSGWGRFRYLPEGC
jgi:hypothetical protein